MPALGIMLIGTRGSGKSLLCEAICNWALGRGMPVLLINRQHSAELVKTFVSLMGPCVVYFDEFGKHYPCQSQNVPDQRDFLPYFSDTSTQGVINLVTANGTDELEQYFFNRPQRFRFRFQYHNLNAKDIQALSDELHLNTWQAEQMRRQALVAGGIRLNWDTGINLANALQACATPEEAKDTLGDLNIPGWAGLQVTLQRVWYRGTEVAREFIRANLTEDETLVVRVLDPATNALLTEGRLGMTDTDHLGEPLSSGESGQPAMAYPRVRITADLVADIEVDYISTDDGYPAGVQVNGHGQAAPVEKSADEGRGNQAAHPLEDPCQTEQPSLASITDFDNQGWEKAIKRDTASGSR